MILGMVSGHNSEEKTTNHRIWVHYSKAHFFCFREKFRWSREKEGGTEPKKKVFINWKHHPSIITTQRFSIRVHSLYHHPSLKLVGVESVRISKRRAECVWTKQTNQHHTTTYKSNSQSPPNELALWCIASITTQLRWGWGLRVLVSEKDEHYELGQANSDSYQRV